jgi:hypothetical protein
MNTATTHKCIQRRAAARASRKEQLDWINRNGLLTSPPDSKVMSAFLATLVASLAAQVALDEAEAELEQQR